MKRLVDLNHAQNIKSAKRMVERSRSVVWDVLEEVIAEHPVLLNRAPTLHRLGIQAFEPLLIEGKAIQIHPLVCTAFNADFDGDQMAVHVPLSAEAQAEARVLMLSSNNILSPASGRPLATPTQDMVLGIFYLTSQRDGEVGEGRAFASIAEALMAHEQRTLSLQAKIKIRIKDEVRETTLGRALLNEVLPDDFGYVESEVTKKGISAVVDRLAESYPKVVVAAVLDQLKALGFYWATRAAATIGIEDVVTPPDKQQILDKYEADADKVQRQYDNGLITNDERRQELIEIWTEATAKIGESMEKNFPRTNPVWMMVYSGARGNMMQIRQIAGMRGLVANPKGEIIARPIKSNFREGLSVLEYFISTHGARKGLADTALRTADSGYLTRRLCDVAQDVIIREEDCGTDRGLTLAIGVKTPQGIERDEYVETSIFGRVLAETVSAGGKEVLAAGTDLGDRHIDLLLSNGVTEVKVRSVLTCDSKFGQCAMCYGRSMASGKIVDVGEAVGIIAAQSIGEPGTQLTMRTFHTGGVAGDDITHGLPRVVELFEARTPKGVAPIAEAAGVVSFIEDAKGKKILVTPEDGSEAIAYPITRRQKLLVEEGSKVGVGEKLVVGAIDPKQVLKILGPRATQVHLVTEIQEVYRSQGVSIHDKHIEIIVRQMLKRATVLEPGDTDLLPGELVDRARLEAENRRVVQEGAKAASGRAELMGITKASLATESWLSAASFQETTRVLTDAALAEKRDPLLGLKENVIIGKLIPAGTGLARYRNVKVEPTEEAKAAVYAAYDEYDYAPFESTGSGEAVRLDEFDVDAR
jgi:DNA-directed RNA polymerase subunit beta'